MDSRQPDSFGQLLKRHRIAAGLSQEALAEQARLSARAISDLERGARHAARRDTVALLAEALRLVPGDRAALEASVVRRRGPVAARLMPGAGEQMVTGLPVEPTSMVDRTGEIQMAVGLLTRDQPEGPPVRLLTLTGPGGVGKTRVALRVAAQASASFADGVVFVALASLQDPALAPSTIVQALGLRETGGRASLDVITTYLRPKRLLLLLDDFEQVAEAAPAVAAILAACPSIKVLVTSRAALRLQGEHEMSLPPLGLPAGGTEGTGGSTDALARAPAVELFLQRARAVKSDLAITPAALRAATEICRRLDGLPLALELAAARSKVLSLQAMVSRLGAALPASPATSAGNGPLGLLAGGARDLPARQQTLRGTMEWSYNLLAIPEQNLFRQLAVFSRGCTLEAVEAVTMGEGSDPGEQGQGAGQWRDGRTLDLLESLIDKSLLRQDTGDGLTERDEPRFIMLETIHAFGLERLAASGALPRLSQRHALYFVELAEDAELGLRGPQQGAWLAELEREHDNFRAALRWAQADGEVRIFLRLVAALERFWYLHGHYREGRAWLEGGLRQINWGDMPGGDDWTGLLARALRAAGALCEGQGDYARAADLSQRSLGYSRALADQGEMAAALNTLGNVATDQADYGAAASLHEESLMLRRALGDRWGTAGSLNNLATVARLQGDLVRAARLCREGLALRRELGDRGGVATSLHNLGLIAFEQGESRQAAPLFTESLALWRELGDTWGIAGATRNLAATALAQGDGARAWTLYQESMASHRELGDKINMAACLEGLGQIAAGSGAAGQALRFLGAAATVRATAGAPLPHGQRGAVAAAMDAGRAAAGGAWTAGETLPLDTIVEEALEAGHP